MIGKTISHYKILAKLGQGGMGEVYLAEDVNLRRKVAFKILALKYIGDPDFQARLTREAQMAAILSHPNIITIYEIGEYDNRLFVAMEYVQGESLRARMTREKLPVRQVTDIVLQICAGLSQAHHAGIVHRDLKPANILIDLEERIKIADFGLAKVQGVSILTQSGIMIGTVPYMSPEQVRGEEPDPRSNIFSMGIVLYELLTRDLPFQGESEYVLMSSIVNEEPQPLSFYDRDLPQGLQDVINKALAKDLENRYQHIDDLAAALKNLGEMERMFKNYRMLKRLGAGGMGEVYLAEDTTLDRKVALKFLSEQYIANPEFKARFKREAQLAAKLNHPNIVTIYEVGEHQNRSYIAMEYIEGESLKDRITRAKLPLQEVLNLMTQICSGVSRAHHAGITHRDIKPANILINLDGQAKILDFGLAKMQGVSGLTKSGATMGTVPYMSPEQVKGEVLDLRSDIFSLGVVLYELLTGDLPFRGESEFTVMSAIANKAPQELARLALDIPRGLQNCIDKALAKDRSSRYQSVDDLQADLKRVMELTLGPQQPGPRDITTAEIYQKKKKLFTSRRIALASVSILALIALGLLFIPKIRKGTTTVARLSVATQPANATVFLNGDSLGVTPLNVSLDQEGMIKLRFQQQGYFAFDTSLVAKAGETHTLSATLEPAARVAIFVDPPDAEVRIDEALMAASRLTNLQLPVGPHRISISRPEYDSKQEQFSLQQGDNGQRRYTLMKQMGEKLPAAMSGLQIDSRPSGASITINGRSAGSTPFQDRSLRPGRYQLALSLDGYENYSTTIEVSAGKITSVTLPLKKASALVGQLSVKSTPDGAAVLLDGQEIGMTPYQSDNVAAGAHQILLRKKGYQDYSVSVNIAPQKIVEVNQPLTALIGRLSVLVKPFGSIYIDDKLEKTDSNLRHLKELPAGMHRVKAVHPTLGMWEKNVSVESDKEAYVEVDFNKRVTLTVTSFDESDSAVWANIYVDNKSMKQITPKRLTLPVGQHTIEVRREGYQVLEEPEMLLLENNIIEPLRFTLRKIP